MATAASQFHPLLSKERETILSPVEHNFTREWENLRHHPMSKSMQSVSLRIPTKPFLIENCPRIAPPPAMFQLTQVMPFACLWIKGSQKFLLTRRPSLTFNDSIQPMADRASKTAAAAALVSSTWMASGSLPSSTDQMLCSGISSHILPVQALCQIQRELSPPFQLTGPRALVQMTALGALGITQRNKPPQRSHIVQMLCLGDFVLTEPSQGQPEGLPPGVLCHALRPSTPLAELS